MSTWTKPKFKKNEQSKTREYEWSQIKNFIDDHLDCQESGCLFISGEPHCGKSNTLRLVCETIDEDSLVNLLYLSGARFPTTFSVLEHIATNLLFRKGRATAMLKGLEKYFKNPHETSTVIIIDDFDKISLSNQFLWLNIFEWLELDGAKLIFIIIANTIDVPERLLPAIITYRMRLTRLFFNPFPFDTLQEILAGSIFDSFEPNAWKILTTTMSCTNADYFRYFKAAGKALEIAQERNSETISISDVNKALIYRSRPREPIIRSLSDLHKIFLKCFSELVVYSEDDQLIMDDIYEKIVSYFQEKNETPPDMDSVISVAERLQDLGLIYKLSDIGVSSRIRGNFLPEYIKKYKK